MQMPHDLIGWLSLGSILLGGLWWVLKNTIVNSISGLRQDIAGLKNELKESNKQANNHEVRLTALETWKHDKWEV
ncbi:hypothetical protein [Leuconostoc citreum]|uniref:hypothetical protein n=1 Tax=Leuconostoc citreum TaxID=33964 RepID=UPI0032DEE78C